ncbi:MAG: hypothetical protein ACYDDU_14515 [Dermatophilaceae bacterium]
MTAVIVPPRPVVIQGLGCGRLPLASAVSRTGQLGVVSGTALDTALARYFRRTGRPPASPYAPVATLVLQQSRRAQELAVLGNFVEVWLAKEGHDGLGGVNYLEKVQMDTPAAAYGAMLAGVDHVLMGTGAATGLSFWLAGSYGTPEQVVSALAVGAVGVQVPRRVRPAGLRPRDEADLDAGRAAPAAGRGNAAGSYRRAGPTDGLPVQGRPAGERPVRAPCPSALSERPARAPRPSAPPGPLLPGCATWGTCRTPYLRGGRRRLPLPRGTGGDMCLAGPIAGPDNAPTTAAPRNRWRPTCAWAARSRPPRAGRVCATRGPPTSGTARFPGHPDLEFCRPRS